MTNPEEQHFSIVWLQVFALAILATVLGLFPASHRLAVALGTIAFGMFIGAEQAAGAVAPGLAGTMTAFAYLKIGRNWQRVLVGVWLAALIWWLVNRWLGYAFLAFLPYHYAGTGKAGPVDRFLTWAGHRFGVSIRTT